MKETAAQKKNRILKKTNCIYMYNFKGELIKSFSKQSEAALFLGKTEATISKYIKKGNRFDGIHFLCRRN